jgi:hypothetical protein
LPHKEIEMQSQFGFSRGGIAHAGVVCFVVIGTAFAVVPCWGADDPDDAIESLSRAWKGREERISTAHFEFIVEEETRIAALPPAVAARIKQNFPDSGEYMSSVDDRALRLSAGKFDHRMTTRDGEKLCKPIGRRTAFDGILSQSYSGRPNANVKGSGVVTEQKYAFDVPGVHKLPILLTYRALHPQLGGGIDLSKCKLGTDDVEIGDHTCRLLKEDADGPRIREYWVDVEHEYVVRRYQSTRKRGRSVRIDIEYSVDPKHGLVPSTWQCLISDSTRRIFESAACSVVSYELNVPLPDSDFQVEFPAGTFVLDKRTGVSFFSKGARAGNESAGAN